MKTVKKIKANPLLNLNCVKCLKTIDKNVDVFVCGSWSNYGYSYYCSKNCYQASGYKLFKKY